MRVTQLDHIAVYATDFETSVAFYRDVLCLSPRPRPDFGDLGAWFQIAPGQELHVIHSPTPLNLPQDRLAHFALLVENESAALAHLDRHHVAYSEPKKRPDGATQIFLRDPDHYLIELCYKQ